MVEDWILKKRREEMEWRIARQNEELTNLQSKIDALHPKKKRRR